MIKTAIQLKALVRNQSEGNSTKAQLIIRNYIMGRFLVRVSLSKYRNNIILKGGSLIASILGIEKRSTMDIDTTLVNITLDEVQVFDIVEEVISVNSDDNVFFEIVDIDTIMEENDYPGIRVKLITLIDEMRIPLIIDFSTGDIITPKAIEFKYKLMFEQGEVTILAYNIETVLAEKFETIISRGIVNSRMRDFYDVHSILYLDEKIHYREFIRALRNTSKKRGSYDLIGDWTRIIEEIEVDNNMNKLWDSYCKKFDYAKGLFWSDIIKSIKILGVLLTSTID